VLPGLKKNNAQPHKLFALGNLWMARKSLLILHEQLRPCGHGGLMGSKK
jgi:hypothetical protein